SERSEESVFRRKKILRFTQDDIQKESGNRLFIRLTSQPGKPGKYIGCILLLPFAYRLPLFLAVRPCLFSRKFAPCFQ
ncbi:MAG: hypothetical protein ACYC5N_03605, partial [Endomicrobiales bacterium]